MACSMDHLIAGRILEGIDMLMGRFKYCQRRIPDGNGAVAKYFEPIPSESRGASLGEGDEEFAERIQSTAAKRARTFREAGQG